MDCLTNNFPVMTQGSLFDIPKKNDILEENDPILIISETMKITKEEVMRIIREEGAGIHHTNKGPVLIYKDEDSQPNWGR